MIKKKTIYTYRNPFIRSAYKSNAENFTSKFGIRARRLINRPFRALLRLVTCGKVVLEKYPKLPKDEVYIFAAAHSFTDDVIAALTHIDRSMYVLNGSKHQIEYNPGMLALALYGHAYVDRSNKESRKESVKKLERILNSGSSVYLYPEGSWNNSENLIILPLFAGPWVLAQSTGCKVVPVAAFNETGTRKIYIRVGDPIDIAGTDKDYGLRLLRDAIATEMYMMMEKHSTKLRRKEMIIEDARLQFLEERKHVYIDGAIWCEDVWDEEITMYKDKRYPIPSDVRETYKKIKLTARNAKWLVPILKQIEEDEKYDFKRYMHQNWDR